MPVNNTQRELVPLGAHRHEYQETFQKHLWIPLEHLNFTIQKEKLHQTTTSLPKFHQLCIHAVSVYKTPFYSEFQFCISESVTLPSTQLQKSLFLIYANIQKYDNINKTTKISIAAQKKLGNYVS